MFKKFIWTQIPCWKIEAMSWTAFMEVVESRIPCDGVAWMGCPLICKPRIWIGFWSFRSAWCLRRWFSLPLVLVQRQWCHLGSLKVRFKRPCVVFHVASISTQKFEYSKFDSSKNIPARYTDLGLSDNGNYNLLRLTWVLDGFRFGWHDVVSAQHVMASTWSISN